MKKLLATTALAILGVAGVAQAEFSLTVLHMNDVHSRLASINKYDSNCNAEGEAEGKCFGGMARAATAIDQTRAALDAQGKAHLTLDAGDQFQGSLFYTTYKGTAAAELMNSIGFDAMAVGNHEFDNGPANLSSFAKLVDFPVLLANYKPNDDANLDGLLDEVVPAVAITFSNGEKVGIVGVVAEDTVETSSPEGTFRMAEDVLPLYVDAFADRGIDKVILLSHLGLSRDMAVAEAVEGIDLIVGGHSHTLLANDNDRAAGPYPMMVNGVPIVQAYAYSKYLGQVEVTFDDDGNVVSAMGDPILLDASFAPRADVAERLAELEAPITEVKAKPVGMALNAIDGDRGNCRAKECQMGNLVSDAILDRVKEQGVDIVIQNGGGLRASIDEGEITMGEVLTVLPFQNTLATFQLKGADVVAALENGVSQVEEGKGKFPQVAGLQFSWSLSKPAGERIVDVLVKGADGWAALDPEATYGVASNNFMRSGGDGYGVFKEKGMNAYDYGPGLENVVAEYLMANPSYVPYTDGRIRMTK